MAQRFFYQNTAVCLNDAIIDGTNITIYGDRNTISAPYSTVYGNYNSVAGTHARVKGSNNIVTSDYADVRGDFNTVSGQGASTFGSNNTLITNVRAHGVNHVANHGIPDNSAPQENHPYHQAPAPITTLLAAPPAAAIIPPQQLLPTDLMNLGMVPPPQVYQQLQQQPPPQVNYYLPCQQQPPMMNMVAPPASMMITHQNQQPTQSLHQPTANLPNTALVNSTMVPQSQHQLLQPQQMFVPQQLQRQPIKLTLRGEDEDLDVDEDDDTKACVVCLDHKAVVASVCCGKRTSCLACTRMLFQDKWVDADARCCLNCRAPVEHVVRIT